jgi:polyphosphate kinase
MGRNINRRVEALVPVETPSLQHRLQEILDVVLADDCLAWTLGPDGRWTRVRAEQPGCEVDSHLRFQELALGRARRGRDS